MKLPPIPGPRKYAGLYVYDFGTHVSVGYTALEIRILRESPAHRSGTAYEVYRVSEGGAMELRGVLDERLAAREALCFLRSDRETARRDYDAIFAAAGRHPLPGTAKLQLAELDVFDPPHVTALSYPAAAAAAIADWLTQHVSDAGDRVAGGLDAHAALSSSEGVRITECQLPALIDYRDRSAEEVMRSIHEPLQR